MTTPNLPVADKAIIEVFRKAPEWHPYPWGFAVTYRGVRHEFAGLPNQCATKRQASIRARWRAKWLEDGTYAQRYRLTEG
jgi:hypothetical protein